MTAYTRKLRHLGIVAGVTLLVSLPLAARPALAASAPLTAVNGGSFTLTSCPLLGILRTSCVLHLNGFGFASGLSTVRDTGTFTANLNLLPLECGAIAGTDTLTAVANPANSVTVSARGVICAPLLGGILGGNAPFTLQYTVTGGTGTFSGASGTGVISGHAHFNLLAGSGTYSDVWSGTAAS
jgi:hypothetical protein